MKPLTKWKIGRIWRRIRVKRKYKDQLFQRVFSNRDDLLDLYNAINQTAYTNSNDLEITTLEDAIYLSMKNDLSFIVSSTLNLYEHQSTFNPNMPIRGLFYFSRLYEAYIKKNKLDIYGRTKVVLPKPQFIVFYNGQESMPDEMTLQLSDCFHPLTDSSEAVLECRTTMLNINYGHNKKLLHACKRLHDYAFFIAEVNKNLAKGFTLELSIQRAIDFCIKQNILADILTKCRDEVFQMILTEYDEKLHLKTTRTEGQHRVNELNLKLLELNRLDDLVKATKDSTYQEQLFKEFGL